MNSGEKNIDSFSESSSTKVNVAQQEKASESDPTITTAKRSAEHMLNETAENDMKRIRSNQSPDDSAIISAKENVATSAAAADTATMDAAKSSPAVVEDPDTNTRGRMILTPGSTPDEVHRWRTHRMAEDYISLCADMMFPAINLAPFGCDAPSGQYPIESITALSILTSPLLRRPTVVEKWSPYEISVFEAALALCGKHFHQVQKFVKTKNTKEVIEFYYVWKKTAHYKVWKKQYISPEDDVDSDDDE